LNCEDNESRYFFVVGLLLKNVKVRIKVEIENEIEVEVD
jgi:hypothetical protein